MALRDLRRPAAGVRPADGTDSGTAPPRTPDRADGPEVLAASSRRWFLRRAAAGGAAIGASAVALAATAPAAVAQTTGSTPGSTPGTTAASSASSSSASGKKPTIEGADLELGRWLHSVELALQQVYQAAIDGGRLKGPALDQAIAFQQQHRDHATKLVDAVQSEAAPGPNPGLLQSLQPRVAGAGTETEVMAALEGIESSAAATYQSGVGQAKDWMFLAMLAAIAAVDGQHVTAWSQKQAPDLATWLPDFDRAVPLSQGTEGSWSPSQYPVR